MDEFVAAHCNDKERGSVEDNGDEVYQKISIKESPKRSIVELKLE
jgi:hypothetical protein